jgi:RNA polymerase sigma-70 factor (ECF subfamily)
MSQTQPNESCDALLLKQVEQGSTRAFDCLFEKYWAKAYSEAFKRLKSHEDAKDIVQEIFLHIWVNRLTLRIENLPAYLHVAIRNRVIKFINKQKPIHSFFDSLEKISEKSAHADAPFLWKEFLKSYEALLKTLPPKRQAIFRLRYQEDLPTRAISMQLGITRKTVQNQLGKAIETLKISLLHMYALVFIALDMF